MITLKTIAQQTVLLLTIGLLAPLHGSAPAHGGAGGEDSAPAASTRRSLSSRMECNTTP